MSIQEANLLDTASAEKLLRSHGIYPTAQRLSIARVLFAEHQHVTAEQLHDKLKNNGTTLSIATVYNAINLFVEKELLKEIFVDNGRTFFDSNNTHHHHCYNVDNGELIDVTDQLASHIDFSLLPKGTRVESVDIVVRVTNQ